MYKSRKQIKKWFVITDLNTSDEYSINSITFLPIQKKTQLYYLEIVQCDR